MIFDLHRPFGGHAILVAVFVALLVYAVAARFVAGAVPALARIVRSRMFQFLLLGSAFMSSILVTAFGFIPLHQQSLEQLPAAGQVLWTIGTLVAILFCAVRVLSASSKAMTWAKTP